MTIEQILNDPECPSVFYISRGVKEDIEKTRDDLYRLMVADPIRARESGLKGRDANLVLHIIGLWLIGQNPLLR